MKKKGLILGAVVLLVAVFAVGCTSSDTEVTPTTPVEATGAATAEATVAAEGTAQAGAQLELTVEELAAFNGKNGNPAYMAVNGVIYDVTNAKGWKDGEHEGYSAGQDLTEPLAQSPHGDSVLKDLTIVGSIKTGS